jgi:hypothetical protein
MVNRLEVTSNLGLIIMNNKEIQPSVGPNPNPFVKNFRRQLKSSKCTNDTPNSIDILQSIRKSGVEMYANESLTTMGNGLKLDFYKTVERPCESKIEDFLLGSKTQSFKTNAGSQLRQLLTTSLPRAFVGTKSFSQMMNSLFEWSLAVDKMSNLITKVNFYVLDISDDLMVKPSPNSRFNKIDLNLTGSDFFLVFVLRTIRFMMKHASLIVSFGGLAKATLSSMMFLLLTSSLAIPKNVLKSSFDQLASKMICPSILFLMSYFEKYLTSKISESLSEKEAEIYANTLLRELQDSLDFLLRMKVKIEELFFEYVDLSGMQGSDFKASDVKVMLVRTIDGFLMGDEIDFDSFDTFLENDHLKIEVLDNGWISAETFEE